MRATYGRVFCLVFLFPLASAQGAVKASPIDNFQMVHSDLYRGARPNSKGLLYLKRIGVKTILNLEDSKSGIKAEGRQAEALGIREISLPMNVFAKPKDKVVNEALSVVIDPSLRPLFVHCHEGKDRTGLIIALMRVEEEKWAPKFAYAEWLKYGFHRILFLMNHYFEVRTGFED